jgi:hypothetical protein
MLLPISSSQRSCEDFYTSSWSDSMRNQIKTATGAHKAETATSLLIDLSDDFQASN